MTITEDEVPTKVVVDCSVSAGLAATVPDILQQASEAAAAGDADKTAELLVLAQQRSAEAAAAPAVESRVELDDDELAVRDRDQAEYVASVAAAVEAAWAAVRVKRDAWLVQTDWMFLDQMPTDTPAATLKAIAASKAAWTSFRQALRDLTADQTIDPSDVVWPTPPDAPSISLS